MYKGIWKTQEPASGMQGAIECTGMKKKGKETWEEKYVSKSHQKQEKPADQMIKEEKEETRETA